MEGLLAVLIGACAVAVSPLVPVMRPVAKAAVKGGLVLAGAAMGVVDTAGQQWGHLVANVSQDVKATTVPIVAEADAEAVVEPAGVEEAPVKTAPVAAAVVEPAIAEEVQVEVPPAEPIPVEAVPVAVDVVEPGGVEAQVEAAAEDTMVSELPEAATGDKIRTAPGGDDLSRIDGIGPKVAALLVGSGITTFEQLAAVDAGRLREILSSSGPRYRAMNPTSWPEQARRLAEPAQ